MGRREPRRPPSIHDPHEIAMTMLLVVLSFTIIATEVGLLAYLLRH